MTKAPYRAIVRRSILKQRGPTGVTYAHETLECGHSYETDATGAARDRAKRRRCQPCADRLERAKARALLLSEAANQTADEVWAGLSEASRQAVLRDVR